MKSLFILLLSVLYWVGSPLAFCYEPFKHPSISIQKAKSKGTFAGLVNTSQESFEWHGHKYKFHELWLEKPVREGRIFYCFTLEVDNKFPAELGGKSLFRGNDGIAWHRKIPVHIIETPAEQEQLDLYVTDTSAREYHVGPPQPGEQHLVLKAAPEERHHEKQK